MGVSRVWNGNFRWLVHYQARTTFTDAEEGRTRASATFVATSTSWLGAVLTQMLRTGGETSLWSMIESDVLVAANRRRHSQTEMAQVGQMPRSRKLSRDDEVTIDDPRPGLHILPSSWAATTKT